MKLVHWPLMGGLLHLVQRGGDWSGPQPADSRDVVHVLLHGQLTVELHPKVSYTTD